MREDLRPLSGEFFAGREALLQAGKTDDSRFDRARQLAAADLVVIAAPFWDMSFPSLLKIYIENVSVEGITFRSTEEGLKGQCTAERCVFLTTRGAAYAPGDPMKRRRSLTIENKILMAVVGICVLSVLCFGFLMLREGYQNKLTQERDKGEELLAYVSWDIRQFGDDVGQDAILEGCAALENSGLVILDGQGARLLGTEQGTALVDEGSILADRSDNHFGWRLCYTLDPAEFQNSLVEEQKYAILATIALLIVTIQVGVFVSYGISEPVRRLAAACAAIGERPQEAAPELIPTDVGSAETRQLADAFGRMLEELRRYNTALAEQKALNESIVENLPLGVVAYGADGQVLCVNDRASTMDKVATVLAAIILITVLAVAIISKPPLGVVASSLTKFNEIPSMAEGIVEGQYSGDYLFHAQPSLYRVVPGKGIRFYRDKLHCLRSVV